MRRSTRLRVELPVRLRSLDPGVSFDEACRTLIVNCHGCGIQASAKLEVGVAVEVLVRGKTARGTVVNSAQLSQSPPAWVIGVELHDAYNIWDIPNPPADWRAAKVEKAKPAEPAAKRNPFAKPRPDKVAPAAAAPARIEAVPAAPPKVVADDRVEADTVDRRRELAAEWESWRSESVAKLAEIEQGLRAEIASGLERWRTETSKASEIVARMTDSSAELQERTESLLKQASEAQETFGESIARSAQQAVDAALAHLQERLGQITQDNDRERRQRLAEEFKGQEKTIQEAAAAHIAELEAGQAGLKTLADELAGTLLRNSEASMAGLRTRVEELLSARELEVAAKLADQQGRASSELAAAVENRIGEINAAADRAMQAVDEHSALRLKREEELQNNAARALEQIDARQAEVARIAETAAAAIEERRNQSLASLEARAVEQEQQIAVQLQQHASDQDALMEVSAKRLEEKAAHALRELDAGIEERRTQLSQLIAEETKQNAESLRSSLRESIAAEYREKIEELRTREASIAAGIAEMERQREQLAAQFEQVHQAKSQVESMLAGAPERIVNDAQERSRKIWEELRAQSEQQIAESVAQTTQAREAQVAQAIEASAANVREEMAQIAQQNAAELQHRFEKVIAACQQQLAAAVTARIGEAKDALTQQGAAIEGRVQSSVAAAEKTLEEMHAKAAAGLSRQTEGALLEASQRVVDAEIARGREQIQAAAAAAREQEVVAIRETATREAAEQLRRAAEVLAEVGRTTERLSALDTQSGAQLAQIQQQLEEGRKWLAAQNNSFQQTIHDAFLQAGGEIRGRVHAAVDTADLLIQQKTSEAVAKLQSEAQSGQATVQGAVAETERKLRQVRQDAEQSVEMMLKERMASTLDQFRSDAVRLAESATARWQSAMEETLKSLPGVMARKLDASADVSGS